MKFQFEKSIIFRIVFILAATAIGLSLATKYTAPISHARSQQEIAGIAKMIDGEVDSVLAQFPIDKSWNRKRQYRIPETDLTRTERRVAIPPEVNPIMINRALNIMAQQYSARAIGSENLKENTVTVHIKLESYIIETISIKTTRDLKRPG
jgi:hypothetical protein